MSKARYCRRPDVDVAGIVCGRPLPCPFHTTIIEPGAKGVRITHRRLLEAKLGQVRMRQLVFAFAKLPPSKPKPRV